MNLLLMNESYKCFECGNRFVFPQLYRERGTFWGSPYTETRECCPFCGSEAFDAVDIDDDEDEINNP